jgi:hypothetical protein
LRVEVLRRPVVGLDPGQTLRVVLELADLNLC